MKTWSTTSHPKGDLYTDEKPVPPLTYAEVKRAMKMVRRQVPKEEVADVLEALGLRRHRG